MMRIVLLALAVATAAQARPDAWPQLCGGASRIARVQAELIDIAQPTWIASLDAHGQTIDFVGPSSPMVWRDGVVAMGRSSDTDRLYCFERADGALRWQANLAPAVAESWSSPAIDTLRGTAIAPSGNKLAAYDLITGAERWVTTLPRPMVNIAPVVTDDLGPRDRCFVTDYSGFGFGAELHCINVSPFDAALNPYHPGDIVWSTPLMSAGSGNTCAYEDGVVYVASAGRFAPPIPGQVLAFDALATAAPAPLWATTNPINEGFYGGVTVEDGAVYAACYSFFGGVSSANVLRLDAATGAIVWCSPSNRTASIPVPCTIGSMPAIVLSTGLPGAAFGSRPALELFDALGGAPCADHLIFETSSATWSDDGDAIIEDGEFDIIGGWTHHPVVVEPSAGGVFMYVGAIDDDPIASADAPYASLLLVDLTKVPTLGNTSGFIVAQFDGCGSSPALAGSNLYCIGASGLYAFGPPPRGAQGFDDAVTRDAGRTDLNAQHHVAPRRGTPQP